MATTSRRGGKRNLAPHRQIISAAISGSAIALIFSPILMVMSISIDRRLTTGRCYHWFLQNGRQSVNPEISTRSEVKPLLPHQRLHKTEERQGFSGRRTVIQDEILPFDIFRRQVLYNRVASFV